MTKASFTACTLLLSAFASGSAQTPVVEIGAVKARLIGRVQAQFNSTSVDENQLIADSARPAAALPATTFEIRRVRLGTELEFGRGVTGKLELETAMGRLFMRDAFVNFEFDRAVQLKVGQWKKPFGLLQIYSSTRWPVIERSVRIRGLNERYIADDRQRLLGRFGSTALVGEEHFLLETQGYNNFDIGAALRGTVGPATYEVGVFNGAGGDALDDTNAKALAGRATVKPRSDWPLVLGVAGSRKSFRARSTPRIETREGDAFEFDLEWGEFRKGLHLLAEATTGRNLGVADTASNKNFMGGQAVAGWFFPVTHKNIEGFELAGRVSYGDPRRGVTGDAGLLLTPGINIYWSGRQRLMFNWDVFNPSGAQFSTLHAFRAQAQLAF